MEQINWSIMEPWNETLTIPKQRKVEPRELFYSSEIGRSMIDVYWSMMGIPPTNDFSDTIRRKMEAGNFYESIVVWVFQRTGILKKTQGKARVLDNPDYLPVYGRYDILAGCDGNWDKRKADVYQMFTRLEEIGFTFPFLDQVKRLSFNLIEKLSEKYKDGLPDKIYEVKSLNSMAFWRENQPIGTPYEHHVNQLTFYQLYNEDKVMEGSFLYVDRDTMSLSELPNLIKEDVVQRMEKWLKEMTHYVKNKIEPPRPEIVLFNEKEQKYQFNWEIDRSPYKDKILEGKDLEKILAGVKQKNKDLREINLMKAAMKNEEKHGVKKYKKAIEMMVAGSKVEEVSAKLKIPLHALMYYQNKLSVILK